MQLNIEKDGKSEQGEIHWSYGGHEQGYYDSNNLCFPDILYYVPGVGRGSGSAERTH